MKRAVLPLPGPRTANPPSPARFKPVGVAVAVASALGGFAPTSMANPNGAQVIAGQASFAAQGNALVVTTQNAPGANHSAINWQNFSIPAGSSTYFQQPGVTSSVINRVVSNNPSSILGSLGSNGQIGRASCRERVCQYV